MPHNLPTALATFGPDEEDDLSTLASAKTSDPDEDGDDSSDYKDTTSDTYAPDKHNTSAQNSGMESDASISVISTASKTARRSRRLIMRNQAATPVRVYNTRLSIGVRSQGGN